MGDFPWGIDGPPFSGSRLGPSWFVVGEGVPGMAVSTVDAELCIPVGKDFTVAMMLAHAPVDAVILWLGINDCEATFHKNAEDITTALELSIEHIHAKSSQTAVILVAFSRVRDISDSALNDMFLEATEKMCLAHNLKALAQELHTEFIDMNDWVETSISDGIHLDEKSLEYVACVFSEMIRKQRMVDYT